jgi:hypothetical protein
VGVTAPIGYSVSLPAISWVFLISAVLARRWPAHHGCPVGRLCNLEVIHASDVLDDVFAKFVMGITGSC